jgi:tRNA-modifying protein YgfZ
MASFITKKEINLSPSYRAAREGIAFQTIDRGLIEVSGSEAEMFLSGLVTSDVKSLADGAWMWAAFPNAQGRLLALARILRLQDKFLFDTEQATYASVLQNLSRFTMAGDFRVRDLTSEFQFVTVRGPVARRLNFYNDEPFAIKIGSDQAATVIALQGMRAVGTDVFVSNTGLSGFVDQARGLGAVAVTPSDFELLRIEDGVPLYGIDMDETTIVPELGLENLISYNKGCYIGQEIIARIHFRGHVAKQLTGLVLSGDGQHGTELTSTEGKNAGRITSTHYSPLLDKFIALAYVRYDYLKEGTELAVGHATAVVTNLPFIEP